MSYLFAKYIKKVIFSNVSIPKKDENLVKNCENLI